MTAYRDEKEPLRSRRDELFARLAGLEVREDAEAETLRRALVRELDEVVIALRGTSRRRLPLVSRLTVKTPCPVKWETMLGTDRVRHCGVCDREVWNLDALDDGEVEAFLAERRTKLPCMRLVLRSDGRYQDGACSAGRARLVRAGAAATALGLLGAVSLLVASASATAPHCRVRRPVPHDAPPVEIMGEMAIEPERAPPPAAWPPPAHSPLAPAPAPAVGPALLPLPAMPMS